MRFVGVDLHKTNFVVCFLSEDDKSQAETFILDHQGLSRFKRRLRPEDKLAVDSVCDVEEGAGLLVHTGAAVQREVKSATRGCLG